LQLQDCRKSGFNLIALRCTDRAAYLNTIPIEYQCRRCRADPQAPNKIEVALGIDIDMDHIGHIGSDICEKSFRGSAGGAECRRELEQSNPFAIRSPELFFSDNRCNSGLFSGNSAPRGPVPETKGGGQRYDNQKYEC
jgi:hypothetical protein